MRGNISIMKKVTLLLLLASIMLTTITSCGDGSSGNNTDVTTSNTADTTTIDDTQLTDSVPELDFEGSEFRTIQQEQPSYYFYVENSTGEAINDALYAQRMDMEERFNVKITASQTDLTHKVKEAVRNSILSNEDVYDLVLNQIFNSGASAAEGLFYDWNDLPHVDLENPWYIKSIQEASVGSKLYMVESDLSLSYTAQTWLLLYNATDAESMNMPNLYDIVDDGAWTIDKLYELSSAAYTDSNGDGKKDENDYYGFAAVPDGCMFVGYLYAGNGRMASISDDMELTFPIAEEHSINVLTKLAKLFEENPSAIKTEALGRDDRVAMFTKGNILFQSMQAGNLILDVMRNLEDEYGVLPLPKYDEGQDEYFTVTDGGADIMTIPKTITNPEMVGALVEAMSAYSYNNITSEYIGTALEQKGTRDERSIVMLRSILDSRLMDFSYLYDGFKGYTMKLPGLIANVGTLKSSIESNIESVARYYEGVINTLSDVD